MTPRAPLTSSKESNWLEPGSLRRYAPIRRRKAFLRAREKSLSDCSWRSIYLTTGSIYSYQAPPTRARGTNRATRRVFDARRRLSPWSLSARRPAAGLARTGERARVATGEARDG